MSFDAKVLFTDTLRLELGKYLNVNDTSMVLRNVIELLDEFDMEHIRTPNQNGSDYLQTYLDALEVEGRSGKTIERYRYLLRKLQDGVGLPESKMTVYHIRKYLSEEKERGISDRTLEGYRQVYSAYFNWLQREGLVPKNPTVNLGPIKSIRKIRTAYTDVDIERLKQNCRCNRDRAIVCFLLATGCRISEMTQLNRSDVDLHGLECKVLGKGNKERTVFLDPVAGMALSDYLALFAGNKGEHERITPHGVRAMLTKLGARAGVDAVHPHKFRRTKATTLIKHGMPIQEVASILGHEKLDTTMGYIVLDKSEVKNSYRKYT